MPTAGSSATATRADYGSASATRGKTTIVAGVASADGRGYLLVGANGNAFTFGDAHAHSSSGGLQGKPVVAATRYGDGYAMVTAVGRAATCSSLPFKGDLATQPPRPVVSIGAYA